MGISICLLSLIFFILLPPATSVIISTGIPQQSQVEVGETIHFNNVNITIRSAERIPIEQVIFTVYSAITNQVMAFVKFDITGQIINQTPSQSFSVSCLFNPSSIPYGHGYSYGYDEWQGTQHTFDHGYGYAQPGFSDISLLYEISYQTHLSGRFYAKLFVESVSHTFISTESQAFMVGITNPSLIPEFTYLPNSPVNDQQVNFSDLSLCTEGFITLWWWDFDDGYASYDQHPTHSFTHAGIYDITLLITNNHGESSSIIKQVIIYSKIPGDINGDGCVNAPDVRYLALYNCGNPMYDPLFSNGDVNNDGRINSADVRYLAMYLCGDPEYIPLYPLSI